MKELKELVSIFDLLKKKQKELEEKVYLGMRFDLQKKLRKCIKHKKTTKKLIFNLITEL